MAIQRENASTKMLIHSTQSPSTKLRSIMVMVMVMVMHSTYVQKCDKFKKAIDVSASTTTRLVEQHLKESNIHGF